MQLMTTALQSVFGQSEDIAQAQFISQLGYSLLEACKFDHNAMECQLCYVAGKLDKHGKELVKQLAAFIQLNEENGPSPFTEELNEQ